MTEKLILKNRGDDFFLLVRTENSESVTATLEGDGFEHKLSLKNCQAIERGYDLEELAKSFAESKTSHPTFQNTHIRDFKEGFQKCLELLGDKKFSEEDMHQALHLMNNSSPIPLMGEALNIITKIEKQRNDIIQSLQQTEWDVDIVQEQGKDTFGNAELTWYNPKLDSDGRLILKRI